MRKPTGEVLECVLCETPIGDGHEYETIGMLSAEGVPSMGATHLECLLRSVVGGIGHIQSRESHEFWCIGVGDPDAGLGYRESAIAVRNWVDIHGMPTEGSDDA